MPQFSFFKMGIKKKKKRVAMQTESTQKKHYPFILG